MVLDLPTHVYISESSVEMCCEHTQCCLWFPEPWLVLHHFLTHLRNHIGIEVSVHVRLLEELP